MQQSKRRSHAVLSALFKEIWKPVARRGGPRDRVKFRHGRKRRDEHDMARLADHGWRRRQF
jgi:hypothetical protein